ncbi:MAG: MFS transporter [Clostridia bacterium]|nr:MFS transporter [Clostridia bacterium]
MEQRKKKLPLFIALCYVLNFYTGFNMSASQFVLLDMKTEFEIGSAVMAIITSASMVTSLGMSLLFSGILDKLDPKKLILIGCAVSISGSLVAGLSVSPLMTTVSYLISGVGSNILLAVPFPAMSKLDPDRITMHVNRQQGALTLGATIAPLIMAVLINKLGLGWRWSYYVSAGMLVLVAIGFIVSTSPGKSLDVQAIAAETPEEKRARKRLILTPAFICMGLILGIYMVMEIGVLNYAKDYFVLELGDVLGASLCISMVRGGMTLSRLFGDRIIKNRVWLCMGSMVLSGVCVLLLAVFRIPIVSLVWCALFGIVAGPCWPTALSMGLSLDSKESGKLSSILMLFNNIGNNLGNVFIGACIDGLGVGNAYYVAAAFAIIGAIVVAIGVKDFRKRGFAPEGPEWMELKAKN